jgi:hypothetical protein
MGTEAFWIPAAIAAAGSIGNAVNQRNATQRSSNAETQALLDQEQYRQQASDAVKNLTQNVAKSNPQQIANQETSNFVNTLRKNEAGSAQPGATSSVPDTNFGAPVSALPPAAGASARYKSDTGKAQTEAQSYGNTIASEMGNIDAAVRQRQNEGLAMQTLGTNLNTLGAESYTKNFVDQLRAQAAGQQNPWVSMFSNIAQRGGAAMAQNGWFTNPGAGGAALGSGTVPSITRTLPSVNPWFDTSGQTVP